MSVWGTFFCIIINVLFDCKLFYIHQPDVAITTLHVLYINLKSVDFSKEGRGDVGVERVGRGGGGYALPRKKNHFLSPKW